MEILAKEINLILNNTIKRIINNFEDKIKTKNTSLIILIKSSIEILNEFLKEIIVLYIKTIDKIYSEKIRNKEKIKITHIRSKKILSEIGEIEITRKRYKTSEGEVFYAVDNFLCLEKRQRIESNYQSKILKESINSTYRASGIKYGVDAKTAYNIAKRNFNKTSENKNDEEKKFVKKLYIEADEDHVNLRGKANGYIKLIYVHEGYRYNEIKQRNELINAKYFSGNEIGTSIWKRVKEHIDTVYYPGTHISISGDGASWIKQGLKYFPFAKFHLDKFHVYQAMTRLAKNNKTKRYEYIKRIKLKDKEWLKNEYYKRYNREVEKDDGSNKMQGLRYLINNLEYIDLSEKNRCSAEGHISNVLSRRMSSRPMGWSRKGANIMAGYLVFSRNGGKIEELFEKFDRKDKNDKMKSIGEREHLTTIGQSKVPTQDSYTILGVEGLQDQISEKLKFVLSQCTSVLPKIL